MLGVHLESGAVTVARVPKPRRPEGFSLIRLLAAGICNTDLELQRGYYGFRGRPGHEFVGEVVESGRRALVGKRVVGEINLGCRACGWCRRGLSRHCRQRTVLGIVRHPGAFAEYLTLPDRNLFVVPDTVPNHHAVFVEPVAAACEILDQVAIPHRAEVAVLGDGKLGLLIAQVLRAHGARVLLFGRHREKLAIARRAGATTQMAGGAMPVKEFRYVVDATGSAAGLQTAVAMTEPRGTVILKSTVHGAVPLNTAPVIVDEITLVGSRCGRFPPAMQLIAAGALQLDEMLSATFPLASAPAAFAEAGKKGVLKVVLEA